MATDAAQRGPPVDSVHGDVLHRLVAACAGATTAELQLCYDALAPVCYRGTTSTPVGRRPRREHLSDLVDANLVEFRDTPRGRVWLPVELPDGLEVRNVAAEARAARD